MGSRRKYFTGVSLAQAVMKAARHFEIEPEGLSYEPVEKRHGFVRQRRNVIIAVDESAPRRDPEAAKAHPAAPVAPREEPRRERPERPRREREPRHAEPETNEEEAAMSAEEPPEARPAAAFEGEADESFDALDSEIGAAYEDEDEDEVEAPSALAPIEGELEDAIWECLEPLLRLADLELEAEIGSRDGEPAVDLSGPDSDRVVARDGEVLEAIEQLLPRLLRERLGERTNCHVDCDGFWQNRERELRSLARKEAREVLHRGSARTLAPMDPRERRIVHRAVTELAGVTTESRGEGRRKRVVIRPA